MQVSPLRDTAHHSDFEAPDDPWACHRRLRHHPGRVERLRRRRNDRHHQLLDAAGESVASSSCNSRGWQRPDAPAPGRYRRGASATDSPGGGRQAIRRSPWAGRGPSSGSSSGVVGAAGAKQFAERGMQLKHHLHLDAAPGRQSRSATGDQRHADGVHIAQRRQIAPSRRDVRRPSSRVLSFRL